MKTKSNAKVLDATASYRSMWVTKESNKVLWIDVEPELDLKPDLLMDCTNTDFEDKRFHTIFFDPPHKFGERKNQGVHSTPSRVNQRERWGNSGAYYGSDKYPTKRALLAFINNAQKEFYRILSDDGILWFKWAEITTTLDALLPFFNNWTLMMKHEVAYRGQVKGATTWWVMFMKQL